MAEPTTKKYVEAIISRLTELAANITASGRLNMTDIHVASEDFYARLLNIAYGWNLKNANVDHPNAEGIDLVDDNEKILVQVSATCSKRKIDHSLEEIDEAYRGYHFYFFPLVTRKVVSQKRQFYSPPYDVVFNPKEDIIEIVDLIRALQADVTGERLKRADNYLKENLRRSIEEGPLLPDYSALKAHLSEQLESTRKGHPSFRLMKIDEGLFPKGVLELHNIEAVNEANELKTIPAIVAESWGRNEKNHLMIEGEGGIGKTVTLLSLPDKLAPHEVPAVYVQLHRLQVEKRDGKKTSVTVETIESYIKTVVFFDNNEQFLQFDELTRIPWNGGPQVLLLLDGFNEIVPEGRWPIGEDINRWAERPGIQIITSSRFDIHSYVPLGSGYNQIQLQPLTRPVIKDYLKGLGIQIPGTKSILWDIITYPLMLSLYAHTRNAMVTMDRRIQDYKPSNSTGAIIWNYLQRELWRYRKDDADVVKCVLANEYIAPYIAWKMQKDSVYFLDESSFDDYLDEAYHKVSELDEKQLPPHIRRVLRHMHCSFPECSDFQPFIEEEQLRLFIRNGTTYTLMHQQFRDALAAMHLINVSHASDDLPEEWKTPVDYYVIQFVDDLISPEEADKLWEHNRKSNLHCDAATINMLELQKRKRKYDFSQLSFSGLDFRNISLYPYRIPETTILRLPQDESLNDGMKISNKTFYPEGHSSEVSSVLSTPDGRRFISGSYDCSIRIWDIDSGQCLNTLLGHTSAISTLAITPNGKRCVSGSFDGSLRIWDIDSGQCLNTFKGHTGGITTLAITSDGKRCISGSGDNTLCIWDLDSGQCLKVLKGHNRRITTLVVTPNGKRCVSGSSDSTLRIWDIDSGQCLKTLEGHRDQITTLVITPDGKRCLSGSYDNSIRIWDVESGLCWKKLEGHWESFTTLAITPDGKRCLSGSYDETIRIWDIDSGQSMKTLKRHLDRITTLAITPDGKRCISGSRDNTLCIWDIGSGQCLKKLEGHRDKITTLAITPNGKRCISGSSDSTLCIWDIDSGQCLKKLEGYRGAITTLAITPDGKRCVSESDNNTLCIRDLDFGRCLKTHDSHGAWIRILAITPDGKRCISKSDDLTQRIWDLDSGQCLKTLGCRYPFESVLAITPDGKRFVDKSDDNTLCIWDIDSGHCLKKLEGHECTIDTLSIFPDGLRCVSGSKDETLRIWDLQTGECLIVLEGHHGGIRTVCITSDGERCISGSEDTTLRIWDTKTGNNIKTLKGHSEDITTLAVTPNGERCVSGSRDCCLCIWDINSGQCLKTLYRHHGWINILAITPDGKKLISGSEDFFLYVWDIDSGQCLKAFDNMYVNVITFSQDGKRCIAGSWEGSVYEFDLETYVLCSRMVIPLDIIGVDFSKAIFPPDLKGTLSFNGAKV